jgi:hypothetical protein
MSLDFYLDDEEKEEECKCDMCDHVHIRKYRRCLFHGHITHNLAEMANHLKIYECLWRPDENNLKYAKEIIPILEHGLDKLKTSSQYYKQYEPSNGWGTIVKFIKFIDDVLFHCKEYPNAEIRVSR